MPNKTRKKRKPNKKKNIAGGLSIPPPLITILVLAALLSLFYLYIHSRNEALGQRIQQLEKDLKQAHNLVLNEESKWANMRSLPSLKAALDRFHIIMNWPDEARVIRLRMTNRNLLEELGHSLPGDLYVQASGRDE